MGFIRFFSSDQEEKLTLIHQSLKEIQKKQESLESLMGDCMEWLHRTDSLNFSRRMLFFDDVLRESAGPRNRSLKEMQKKLERLESLIKECMEWLRQKDSPDLQRWALIPVEILRESDEPPGWLTPESSSSHHIHTYEAIGSWCAAYPEDHWQSSRDLSYGSYRFQS